MPNDEDGEGSPFDTGFYEESFSRFAELGEDQVSSMLSNGQMPLKDYPPARVWLGRIASERDRKSKRNATSAKAIAIISIIVAIAGVVIAHLDAVKALFH